MYVRQDREEARLEDGIKVLNIYHLAPPPSGPASLHISVGAQESFINDASEF
jgi:hypothetical protein